MTRKTSMTVKAMPARKMLACSALATALLVCALLLAACVSSPTEGSAGGSAGAGPGSSGAATPNAPAPAAGNAGANAGAGGVAGGNAITSTTAVSDVGSASNGAQPGSNGATGATAPDSATAGDNAPSAETGNTGSGTGNTAAGGTGAAGGATAAGTPAAGNDATGGNTAGGNAAGDAAGDAATGGESTPVAGVYIPVSNEDCSAAQQQLATALGVKVDVQNASANFTDLNNKAGQSCRLVINGTGAQFQNLPDTAQRIAKAFTDAGWAADPVYAADSPTGTIGGLRKGKQFAAYNIGWTPAQGVTCPQDQPISECASNLAPEQMNYTITIDLAQEQ